AIIYEQRAKVLNGEDIHEYIQKMIKDWVADGVNLYIIDNTVQDEWNLTGLREHFAGLLTTPDDFHYTPEELGALSKEKLIDMLTERANAYYEKREKDLGSDMLRELERVILLKVVDLKWMAHIDDMEELRRGIGLRAFGQKNPVVEYRYEGFEMFDAMIESIREDTVRLLFTIQVKSNEEPKRERVAEPMETQGDGSYQNEPRRVKKVGRNDPCPCGSGKKYKNCCGRDLK
ncbi:MAG: SEC-C metal-binding domain-containing protein, partial [Oscillospiraceae bacterium]|nr:SEC-C metal-binding domain-containing protein [Oscillospiraceae bacterium]